MNQTRKPEAKCQNKVDHEIHCGAISEQNAKRWKNESQNDCEQFLCLWVHVCPPVLFRDMNRKNIHKACDSKNS